MPQNPRRSERDPHADRICYLRKGNPVIHQAVVVAENEAVAILGWTVSANANEWDMMLGAELLTGRRDIDRVIYVPRAAAHQHRSGYEQCDAHSSNENKISYRWRERALLAIMMWKPRGVGGRSGQRLAASPS